MLICFLQSLKAGSGGVVCREWRLVETLVEFFFVSTSENTFFSRCLGLVKINLFETWKLSGLYYLRMGGHVNFCFNDPAQSVK